MVYFALCFYLIHGPVPPDRRPLEVPAERIFAMLEQASGRAVRRTEPGLDLVRVRFREPGGTVTAPVLSLVLRAHGIYVHAVVTRDGEEEFFASRSEKPPSPERAKRLHVEIYAPRYVVPEKLLAVVRKTRTGERVEIVLEPRTGKLILRGEEAELVAKALELVRSLDRPRERARAAHLFRASGMFVKDAHAELLRRLPRAVRRRIVMVPYHKANTLVVACGSDDWEVVLKLLRAINPEGEVVQRGVAPDGD
jgi:hypothetical protein